MQLFSGGLNDKVSDVCSCINQSDPRLTLTPCTCAFRQVKVWFQNRRMKWRHSKEAQAQKDKDDKPDPGLSEAGSEEPKEPLESDCESEARSDSDSDEPEEDSGHLDVSDLNKTSVITSGSAQAGGTDAGSALTDTEAPQVLI